MTIAGPLILVCVAGLGWACGRVVYVCWREARRRQDAPVAPTTKVCPHCFGKCMVQLPSLRLKICVDCQGETSWDLDEGQTYTLQPSRATRKVKPA